MTKTDKTLSLDVAKLLIWIFILTGSFGFAQKGSNEAALERIDSLLSASDYSGAQRLALDYLHRSSLSDIERFRFWMIRAGIIRASGRPKDAIEAYEQAEVYLPAVENRTVFLSQIQMRLAECFFDARSYTEAAFHAKESLRISPDTSMAKTGHAINYLILGYTDFLNKHYSNSLKYYKDALVNYQVSGQDCELPLVYTKMARVANALGSSEEAIEYINKCKAINDSCGIKVYDLLTHRTLFEIYKENGRYKDALSTYEKLEKLKQNIEFNRQNSEMVLMEEEYETNLRRAEIEALKQVNKKNEVIKEQQNRFLWIALTGILGLAALSLLLARANKRRSLTLKELEKLNQNLELEVAKRTAYLGEANENIKHQAEAISGSNTGLTELYHMVSHDIRGPINNLKMLISLIEETDNETERNELIEHLKPVLESLCTTANQLLEKVDSSNRIESDLETAKFAYALDRAKKGLQVELKSSKAKIVTDFQQAESVLYSTKYLTSVFHNFIRNSLKYSHPDRIPSIVITAVKNENAVLLKYTDNGRGIDMETNGHKLFQFKEVFNDRPDAKGIGLYMLKTQIERAGGEIWAESEVGRGTDFFVRFNA